MEKLKQNAQTIKNETQKGANTANRVGQWMLDCATQIENLRVNTDSNSILAEDVEIFNPLENPIITSEDGTAGLQSAIDKKRFGGKITFPQGQYTIANKVLINKNNICLEGEIQPTLNKNNTIDRGAILQLNQQLEIKDQNITDQRNIGLKIKNMGFTSTNTSTNAIKNESTIAEQVTIENCIFSGFETVYNGSSNPSDSITFRNVKVRLTSKFLSDKQLLSKNITIDNCNIETSSEMFELNHAGAMKNLIIRNSTLLTQESILENRKLDNLEINNSIISSTHNGSPVKVNGNQNRITNNTFNTQTSNPMEITGNSNMIANNRFNSNKTIIINGNENLISANIFDNHNGSLNHYEVKGNFNYIVASSTNQKINIAEGSEENVLVGFKYQNITDNGEHTTVIYA